MVATFHIAATTQIGPSYSPGSVNVYPNLIYASLSPSESALRTAFRSVLLFLHGTNRPPT